jgi:hypothetical protein
MKTCPECYKTKPNSGFYRMGRGYGRICKTCTCERERRRRLTDPAVQARERARAKQPKRKAAARAVTIEWRRKHPEAYKAQMTVGNALRDGRISRGPCALCGTTKNIHGHHKDYRKPLDVTWLCAKCHHRIHAIFPELSGHHPQITP